MVEAMARHASRVVPLRFRAGGDRRRHQWLRALRAIEQTRTFNRPGVRMSFERRFTAWRMAEALSPVAGRRLSLYRYAAN
jgi:hypothetical protein